VAETIREFLVGLGFKVDGGSEAKFARSIQVATKGVVALGVAAVAASTAITAAVTKIAAGFDELYYASQRTKASAENIKAVGFAVSQLGGSYQGAVSSIEAFALKMRSNPGYESMARNLGVVTRENGKLKDTTVIMTDLARVLAKKPQYVTLQYLEALGIDEATYEALKSGDLVRYTEEYRKKQAALGVDQSRAASIGKELTQAWRSLGATAAAVGDKLLVSLGPGIKDFVDRVDAFLTRNADKIVAFFERAADWVGKLLAAFVQLVEKGEGPLVEFFDKMTAGVEKMETAFKVFAAFLGGAFLLSVLGSFSKVGAGFAGLLLKLGINPLTLGVGGALALSTGSANAGEDQEIARQRAAGTWGKNKFDGTNPAPKDTRNWWQRTMPKAIGGKDAPAATEGGQGVGGSAIPGLSEKAAADYANRLGKRESGNNYAQPGNQFGFRGRWQMGGPALVDAGYAVKGTTNRGLTNPSNWTGKDGLGSLEDFLANKDGGQDKAFAAYTAINYKRLVANGTIEPGMSEEEIAGWLAAAHLKGPAGARQLKNGIDNVDGNGTSASSYFRMMKGLRTGSRDQAAASPGFSAFDPSKAARIQGNAAMGQGAFGIGGPVLVPPVSNSTNVDMNQKTEITILGGGDPQATAREVAGAQDKVNGGMLRNMAGAVR